MGTVPTPEGFTLLGPVAHAHDFAPIQVNSHSIPEEFPRAGKSKITNVVSLINPSLFPFGFFFLVRLGLLKAHDENRLLGISRLR